MKQLKSVAFGYISGYVNAPKILNNVCNELFSDINLGVKARSIDEEDLYEAMEDNWGFSRKTETFTNKVKFYNEKDSTYPYGSIFSPTCKYIPNCYSSTNITDEQLKDLRNGPSNASPGFNEMDGFMFKTTRLCGNVKDLIGNLRFNLIKDSNMWLASREVYGDSDVASFRNPLDLSRTKGYGRLCV